MLPARANILRSIPAPSFARDFAATKALNNGIGPAISFSRGSNATYFDGTGTLQYAPNNLVRNGNATGSTTGIIGSGGALPTNWSRAATTGINQQIVGTGTANGMAYIDIRISGTNTSGGTGFPLIAFEATTGIAAISGLSYLASVWMEVVAGSWTGFSLYRLTLQELTSGGASNGGSATSALGTAFTRYSIARTVSNATSVYVRPYFDFSIANAASVDVTMRIYGGQVELTTSSTPSDYFPTTGSAAYYGPRFDHDPVTLTSKGLLIEEARSNLNTYSGQMQNWTQNRLTLTANATGSPDGTTSATKLTETTAAGLHYVQNTVTITTGFTYTFSDFVKSSERSFAYLGLNQTLTGTSVGQIFYTYDLTNLTYSFNSTVAIPPTFVGASITSVGNGWVRISLTVTVAAVGVNQLSCYVGTATSLSIINYAGDGTSGIYAWGGQLESNSGGTASFPTSYIPTGASQVTRNADLAQITGTAFTNLYNPNAGTLFASFSGMQRNGAPVEINDATANNCLTIRGNTSPPNTFSINKYISNNAIVAFFMDFTGSIALSNFKLSMGFDIAGAAGAQNGIFGSATGSGMPTATQLSIGYTYRGGGIYACAWISKIAYYPMRLSDQWLYKLTV